MITIIVNIKVPTFKKLGSIHTRSHKDILVTERSLTQKRLQIPFFQYCPFKGVKVVLFAL